MFKLSILALLVLSVKVLVEFIVALERDRRRSVALKILKLNATYIQDTHTPSDLIVSLTKREYFIGFEFISGQLDVGINLGHDDSVLQNIFPFEFIFRVDHYNLELDGFVLSE
jgi:hypothetical protein